MSVSLFSRTSAGNKTDRNVAIKTIFLMHYRHLTLTVRDGRVHCWNCSFRKCYSYYLTHILQLINWPITDRVFPGTLWKVNMILNSSHKYSITIYIIIQDHINRFKDIFFMSCLTLKCKGYLVKTGT